MYFQRRSKFHKPIAKIKQASQWHAVIAVICAIAKCHLQWFELVVSRKRSKTIFRLISNLELLTTDEISCILAGVTQAEA